MMLYGAHMGGEAGLGDRHEGYYGKQSFQAKGRFVPHVLTGMKALMGGAEKMFDAELEEFFANVLEDFLWNDFIIIILMNQ